MSTESAAPHVLILVENLPVPADRRVWQEAGILRDAGYRVSVVCPQMHGFNQPEEVLEGIRIYRYPLPSEGRSIPGLLREYAATLLEQTRLAWLIWRRERFRVIHLCNPPDLLFLVALPFRLRGVRVVFDSHDLCPELFEAKFGPSVLLGGLVRLAQRLTYLTAHVVLVTNETHRRNAVERGGKRPEHVYLVSTLAVRVAPDVTPDDRMRRGRRFLVGYVGVLGSADGVDVLLEAAAELVHRRGRQDVQFLLLGAGPESDSLRARRDQLNLRDHVEMPGWAAHETVATMLRSADLAVVCDPPNPYNHSCTMCKVLDALACGCPQVLFDLHENRAVAGDAARYVAEYTPQALAAGIEDLLDASAERARLAARARARHAEAGDGARTRGELLRAYRAAIADPR